MPLRVVSPPPPREVLEQLTTVGGGGTPSLGTPSLPGMNVILPQLFWWGGRGAENP